MSELSSFDRALVHWIDEQTDHGVFTTDTALVVRTWNRWLEAQTGYLAADVVGRPLLEVYPEIRARGLEPAYRDALAGEVRVLSERFHKYLIPITRSVAAVGVAEMAQSARIGPLEADGTVVGTITVIDDVTERVVSERELRTQIAASERARQVAEEASRLKDEFLATLSHEIRTPLNAVLGWARLLQTQPRLRNNAHALEVIERNAAAQLRLVEDLLDMARIISGKLRLDIAAVDVAAVAREAIEAVAPAADAKQITLRTSFAPDLPPVSGDADRLRQVVWNLLSNAVKFTDRGGRVELTATRREDELELSILDTGQGIPHDFLPYVFDRFRQADASASRRHGGLGLGLALVQQIVALHGGTATVQSDGPGRGTTFTVRLPAATHGESHAEAAGAADAPVTLRDVAVLVVDDDRDSRDLLSVALSDYGARVRDAESADAAIDLITTKGYRPDVLVSDVGMPNVDGYALIRRIRSLPGDLAHIPAIAVTAYANAEDRVRALVVGYQTHMPKPVDVGELAATIAAYARGKSAPPSRPEPRSGGL